MAAEADVERLVLLDEILDVVFDDDLDDAAAGAAVRGIDTARLASAVRTPEQRRVADRGHLQLVEASFSHVRSFAPPILGALTFAASVSPSEVLDAVVLLQAMNADGRRHVPDGAPTAFVPTRCEVVLLRHSLGALGSAGPVRKRFSEGVASASQRVGRRALHPIRVGGSTGRWRR